MPSQERVESTLSALTSFHWYRAVPRARVRLGNAWSSEGVGCLTAG